MSTDIIPEQLPSYKTVTETFDFGPCISKVIIHWPEEIESETVTKDSFKVYARRILPDGAFPPIKIAKEKDIKLVLDSTSKSDNDLQGYREITKVYVSDENGNNKPKDQYITIEMSVHPKNNLCSALNFNAITFFNNFVTPRYTIIQVKPIKEKKNLIIENYKGDIRPIVDKFTFSHKNHKFVSLGYASYEPSNDKKHPLIIWLHGMGEGGSDTPALPIMGNKAIMFADESLQKYFDGAYVLAPQCPTFWMHGYKHFGDGTSIYEDSLMELIKSYVNEHKNIDNTRIYLGGDSNGGYMTMVLLRDYPDYFAAGFPTCEALRNDMITDEDILKLSKTPLWFISAKTDTTVNPNDYAVPTVERLKKVGADVHFSFFDDVHDTSGLFKKEDGKPYEYYGHWSWIYVYNDECEEVIDGKKVKLMEWMASKKKN